MDLKKGFPNMLCPDMSNDGRSDIIVPYADNDNRIRFSILECIGTGYRDAKIKKTNFEWTDGSKFMAVDLSENSSIDIVQIFTDAQKLTFRNFAAVTSDGTIGLKDAVTTRTNHTNTGTIDWFQLNHASTGAKSLVRI
ncbi:hypothetical protein ACHAPE_002900 [Trichoderma viride]